MEFFKGRFEIVRELGKGGKGVGSCANLPRCWMRVDRKVAWPEAGEDYAGTWTWSGRCAPMATGWQPNSTLWLAFLVTSMPLTTSLLGENYLALLVILFTIIMSLAARGALAPALQRGERHGNRR